VPVQAAREGVAAKALAFAILTAARSGEVRGIWEEVDDANRIWTVPAERSKSGKEHRVPLPTAALVLLGAPGETGALVFPSATNRTRPLSDATLTAVLKRMGRGDLTAHGFRSTFRAWAGETTATVSRGTPQRIMDRRCPMGSTITRGSRRGGPRGPGRSENMAKPSGPASTSEGGEIVRSERTLHTRGRQQNIFLAASAHIVHDGCPVCLGRPSPWRPAMHPMIARSVIRLWERAATTPRRRISWRDWFLLPR